MTVEQRPDQLSKWQQQAMTVPESLDLFLGGGRGGGKSFLLAALFLRHCEQHGSNARCLVVRKSFPGLQDLEAEFRTYFANVYGNALRFDGQKHRFTLPNGATIQLDQLERENDFSKYQGKSFSHIAVDEAGQYNSPSLVDRLRSSLRAPVGVPVRFVIVANPGGVGHAWLVRRYALQEPWKPYTDPATGFDFVTIASTYRDNDFIDRDRYAKNLMASCATDPELGRAWLDGDWSVLRGAYFATVIEEQRVMLEPWPHKPKQQPDDEWSDYPTQWHFYLAHDFGVAAPSVTYLVARSPGAKGPDDVFYPRDSIILMDEETTTHPDDLNAGLGLTVPDQADRIKAMCQRWKVSPSGVADDAIFNRTGSQEGSIADEFRRCGVAFSKANKGGRLGGWQKMRRLLADAGQPDVPGLYVSRKCQVWWQTVPALPRDPRNPEDVDSTAADHAADACRYALQGDYRMPRVKIKMW
ncbi:phage terminase large subunit [Marinobacter sp.]|uniref:phage terminase large subunit n=1 Tax=Marinobacter sp. TaxID=50741 RepID=UPI001B6C802E|nr:phage terminase large subunit [Marinobacter sp.]MBQ0834456.1 phage terminase large subunit [Marinobacter sp.]